jgi:hypothetical protein
MVFSGVGSVTEYSPGAKFTVVPVSEPGKLLIDGLFPSTCMIKSFANAVLWSVMTVLSTCLTTIKVAVLSCGSGDGPGGPCGPAGQVAPLGPLGPAGPGGPGCVHPMQIFGICVTKKEEAELEVGSPAGIACILRRSAMNSSVGLMA